MLLEEHLAEDLGHEIGLHVVGTNEAQINEAPTAKA